MEAIEFIANVKDGTVKIPKKYLSNLPKEFRIIILINKDIPVKQKEVKKRQLSALKVKTKGLHFDREEANAR